TDADVLLGIRPEIDANRPTGRGSDRPAESTSITPLEEPVLDLRGEDVLELVHAAHREELIERVDAAASARFAVRGQEEGCLVDPIRVALGREILVEERPGLAGDPDEGRQNVDLVEDAVRAARLNHALPVNEGGHAYAALPARAFASTPRTASMRRDFLLR